MGVGTLHDDYEAKKSDWIKCRDFIEGSGAVKAKKDSYLPKLSAQEDADYTDYLDRALFYNASGRTHSAMVGSVMRKDPQIKGADGIDLTDVSLTDLDIIDFSRRVVDEVLRVGRYGVLVEFSDEESKPYFVGYSAEQIINWRVERREGRMEMTLVVLTEEHEEEGQTPFEREKITYYRALRLVDGVYTVELYRSNSGLDANGNSTVSIDLEETIVPTRRGDRLDSIPFQFFGPENLMPTVQKPPLLDLIEVNRSHYCSSADLENGRHLVGLPTPIFTGFDLEDEDIVLGAKNAIHTTDTSARAYFLEFTGSGLVTLEKALESKEKLMAVMGAKLLQPPTQQETAETARIHQAGEASVLGSISSAVSDGITNILRRFAWWSGKDSTDDIEVQLNLDFIDFRLDAGEFAAIMQAYQNGSISYETFFYNMQRGELMPPGRTMEDEQSAIERAPPPGLDQSTVQP